jgi:hypothetical protein
MNKIKKIVFIVSLLATAGITYTIATLKNMPESFDWDDQDDS